MKKVLIAVALFIACATTSLFAVEWGGIVNDLSKVSTSDFKTVSPYQSNGVYFWVNGSLTKDKSLRFATEAMYRYDLVFKGKDAVFTNVVDLDLLKLSGNWDFKGSALTLDAGRFQVIDNSGKVFAQNSDGVNLRFGNINWSAGLYAGYTGLQNSFNVVMTEANEERNDQFYSLCYGYVPLMVDFSLKNLGGNTLGAQVSFFLDTTKNKLNKGYVCLAGNGALGNIGSYNVSAVVGTENFKNLMLAANMDLSFYVGNFMLASVGAEFTSGDHDGGLSLFKSVSYRPIHSSPSVDGSADVLVPRITCMVYFDNLCISANEKLVMSIPASGFTVNGSGTSVDVIYNLFSDLQLGCTLSAYADFVNKDSNSFGVTLNAALSF